MERAFLANAIGTPPTAPVSPSLGYPTAGDPAVPTPATTPGPYWYHMVTEEIRKVITDAGLTPSQSNITQLSAAITALINTAVSGLVALSTFTGSNQSKATNGYQKLPGGVIIQWGQGTTSAGNAAVTYPLAFPTAVKSVVGMTVGAGVPSALFSGDTTPGNASFNMKAYNSAGTALAVGFSWIAIGY